MRSSQLIEMSGQRVGFNSVEVLRPIVRMLASWVENMLVEGTAAKRDPADVTVRTYLTRIYERAPAAT